MNAKKTAVVLANLGGPTRLDEVRPFLKNLFQDPDIFPFPFGRLGQALFSSLMASLRAPKSRRYYAAIGGGSPLHRNTVAQAEKLQEALQDDGPYKVYVAQRYWQPTFGEVTQQVREAEPERVIVIPLYPQYSATTTLSIMNEWSRHGTDLPPAVFTPRFYDRPSYIQACGERIREQLPRFSSPPHILFSAHSLPLKLVQAGDHYPQEVEENCELIMDDLGREYSYSLAYQSKVGPVKWLEPSVEAALDTLVQEGSLKVLVFPISFVSEHVETLYELDIQKRAYALEHGIHQYERAATVQESETFIGVLKELVLEA